MKPQMGRSVKVRIYGNHLGPTAPAKLHLDVVGLQKLYGFVDVNSQAEVAPNFVALPIVKEAASVDVPNHRAVTKKDGPAA